MSEEWEYYSIRYYESCEQWQSDQDGTQTDYWNNLGIACNDLAVEGYAPLLLSNNVVLFRRVRQASVSTATE